MQNTRVANGHTKKLQKGCAKGQKKEQRRQNYKPTRHRGSNPDLPIAGVPLCHLARDETLCGAAAPKFDT
jgi:hypothetical protein